MSYQRTPGGPAQHKNPNCACNYCKARRRAQEAISQSDGIGRVPLDPKGNILTDVIEANAPLVTYGATALGNSSRDRVGQWVLMRHQEPGIKNIEVARRLGITIDTLNYHLNKATKEGWLKFDDPMSRIEHEIVPKVLANLSEFLDKKDKTVTIETAKGTVFKQFQESKGISESPQMVVAIKIEAADPDTVRAVTGQIVGKGRDVEESQDA